MIQIAICDDDQNICEELRIYIDRWGENHLLETDIFYSGEALEEELKEKYYDLIFLDIVLKGKSGIELGRILREKMRNDSSQIIYISRHIEYAIELFQFQPLYFLQKPIKPAEFQKVFYLACDRVEKNTGIFEFKSGRKIHRIPFKEIMYFEGDNRRVKIVTQDSVHYCYSTIEKLFSQINMEKEGFMRIHKSYAVNTNYISTFTTKIVIMFDGTELTVSAQFKEKVQKWYEVFAVGTGR